MDELRRHAAPLVDRWQRLARGQRIALVGVLIASAVGFCFLLNRPSESWQPIADGREFNSSELAAIQSAWRQAGLKTFRRDAHRLLVPSADMARYTAALPKSQRDDHNSGDERSPSLAKANLFTSPEQLVVQPAYLVRRRRWCQAKSEYWMGSAGSSGARPRL